MRRGAGAGARPAPSRARRDERALAAAAVGGCRESFGELALLFTPRVYSLLRQRGMREPDAEDATQEAFAQAWRSLRTYDPSRPFAPWIFQIAVRSAARAHRRRSREVVSDGMAWEASGDAGADGLETRERAAGVWALAQRVLSAEQNTLLWLVYVEGLSGPEAARATGKTPVGVRVALHRARKRLERSLEGGRMGEDQA